MRDGLHSGLKTMLAERTWDREVASCRVTWCGPARAQGEGRRQLAVALRRFGRVSGGICMGPTGHDEVGRQVCACRSRRTGTWLLCSSWREFQPLMRSSNPCYVGREPVVGLLLVSSADVARNCPANHQTAHLPHPFEGGEAGRPNRRLNAYSQNDTNKRRRFLKEESPAQSCLKRIALPLGARLLSATGAARIIPSWRARYPPAIVQ